MRDASCKGYTHTHTLVQNLKSMFDATTLLANFILDKISMSISMITSCLRPNRPECLFYNNDQLTELLREYLPNKYINEHIGLCTIYDIEWT